MSPIRSAIYVNFQGRAREAMEFYREVLGGTLELQAMNGQGKVEPAGPGDRIWHSRLEADGVVVQATDGKPDYPTQAGNNVAIALGGKNRERLSRIFEALAVGGTVLLPLAPQPWEAEQGWVMDRFGTRWKVEIGEV